MNKLSKDEMLKYLEHWCNSKISRNGRVFHLCVYLPHKHGLNESWCSFWEQIDMTEIGCVENCFGFVNSSYDRYAMVSIARMLLLHDFVNWLYEENKK